MPLKVKQSPSAKVRHQNLPSQSKRHNSRHALTHFKIETVYQERLSVNTGYVPGPVLGVAHPRTQVILTMTLIMQQKEGSERVDHWPKALQFACGGTGIGSLDVSTTRLCY